jgi:hypothetical protein
MTLNRGLRWLLSCVGIKPYSLTASQLYSLTALDLQIRELLKLEREAFIRDRLGKLPKDLKATYNEMFESIICQDDG